MFCRSEKRRGGSNSDVREKWEQGERGSNRRRRRQWEGQQAEKKEEREAVADAGNGGLPQMLQCAALSTNQILQ